MRAVAKWARRSWPYLALVVGLAACGAEAQEAGPKGFGNRRPSLGRWLVRPRLAPGIVAPVDDSIRRVQASNGNQPSAPTVTPGSEAATPNPSETGTPRADNPVSGSEPTEANQEAQQDLQPAEPPERGAETTLLMNALGIPQDNPVRIYGWIQNSFTGNTNGRPPSGENFGVIPNDRANQWLGNFYLVVENPLEQNDTINFGFRVDNLFGHDSLFTHMHGLFNNSFQLSQLNNFGGYDPVQMYAEVHLPILTRGGLDVRGGRFYTLVGYEVGPATGLPLISFPYTFSHGQPYTHLGIMSTLHFSENIEIYNCIINGWDRWFDVNYRPNYMGGFSWTFNEDKTNLTIVTIQGPNQFPRFLGTNLTIIPAGATPPPFLADRRNLGYPNNNRSLFSYVLSHEWSDKLTQVVEFDHAFEENIPGLGPGGFGTGGAQNAKWYGGVNWLLYQFNDKLTGVWRSEVWRDDDGARTGVVDTFYEQTLGAIYKFKPWLWFRHELRYDWAQSKTPYNDCTRGSQFTLAFDTILLY